MSEFVVLLPLLKEWLHKLAKDFAAGRVKLFVDAWKRLTSDPFILAIVQGVAIEFDCPYECLPTLSKRQAALNDAESGIIDAEVHKLLLKGVISRCTHEHGEVISPVFTRPKKDGTFRMILNLKKMNEEVSYYHFKMDTLVTALELISKGCFMASIDLKDAYYSVPILETHKKFLRFEWQNTLYQFNAMPNGLALAPRTFTKLLKPVFASLRAKGHVSTAFLDDSLLLGSTETECMTNVRDTLILLQELGFVVHPEKSVLIPSQQIQYLGVIIDSSSMKVTLTADRKNSVYTACTDLLRHCRHCTIREVARVVGLLVASFPAVKYGPLHYRILEDEKKCALKKAKGNFDSYMQLSPFSQKELQWWIEHIHSTENDVCVSEPDCMMTSDASLIGWGCEFDGTRSGGLWLPSEKELHINLLEIKAAYFALQSFQDKLKGCHVRLMVDNTTAVACINSMGTNHSLECNKMTNSLWLWCIANEIWISAAHIPGKENVVADYESRHFNLDAEWKLNRSSLQYALNQLQASPVIDLFASRVNKQFCRFVSYRPDPEAEAVDAFSLSWRELNFYAFPPFCIICRVLQKVRREQATGVIVVPDWSAQPWYPVLHRLLEGPPVKLRCSDRLLQLPSNPEAIHPLILKKRLNVIVCKISGKNWPF